MIKVVVIKIALLSVLVGIFASFLFYNASNILGTDYISYYNGSKIIAEGRGKELYIHQDNSLRTLPISGLYYLPFTYFALIKSYHLFVLFNEILLIFLLFLIYKYFFKDLISDVWLFSRPGYLIIFSLLLFPVFSALGNGSLGIVMAIFLLSSFIFLREEKYYLSSLFLALFIVTKLQYLTIVPFLLLIVKNKKFYLGLYAFSVLLILVNMAVSGAGFLWRYVPFLISTETASFTSSPVRMYSIFGILRSIFGFSVNTGLIINAIIYAFVFVYFYLLFKKVSNRANSELFLATSVMLSVIFAVHVLFQDLALLILPGMFLYRGYLMTNSRKFLVPISLLGLLMLTDVFTLNIIMAYNVGGLLLIITTIFVLLILSPGKMRLNVVEKKHLTN
jgi:hypothetical protein